MRRTFLIAFLGFAALWNSVASIAPDGIWRADRLLTSVIGPGFNRGGAKSCANRRTIRSCYSAGNMLLATNITEFDRRGNTVKITDAETNVFTNIFDGLDRIKVAAGPTSVAPVNTNVPSLGGGIVTYQQINTYAYDASGQVQSVTNNLGEKTITTADALGRPVRVEVKGANNVTVRLTTTTYAANQHSLTVTSGSGTNAISTTAYTDNDGHPVLTLAYPANGVLEYTWQNYDVGGNRLSLQQLSSIGSQSATWATNAWTYDGLHRVVTETVRDGAKTTISYDALNDVLSRAMPNGVTWTGTYTNDGRILTEQDSGTGGLTGRSLTYQYYPAGNASVGRLQLVTDGRGVTRTNSYDDYLRLSGVNTGGSGAANEQKMSLTYQYNRRGLLTSLTQSFADTNTGPQTVIARVYNAAAALSVESLSIGGTYQHSFDQTWDNAARRIMLGGPGGNETFSFQADGLMTGVNYGLFGMTYSYGDNGYLSRRYNAARDWRMNSRDGRGRLLQTTTYCGVQTALTEYLLWQGDGRVSSYTAVRASDFTDTRTFGYSPLAQNLTTETLFLGPSQPATNSYTFDFGQPGGLGVLTKAAQASASPSTWSLATNGLDGLRRVVQQTNSLVKRAATGRVNGPASISASLNGLPVGVVYDPTTTNGGRWWANLDMPKGTNKLVASAASPSGFYTASTTNIFTNNTASQTITNQLDGNGNVTVRVCTNWTQTLTWDAFNRLVKETLRDNYNSGYDRTCIYDGLGRRLRTIHTGIISNVYQAAITTDSFYDPSIEFLEVEFSVNGQKSWKVYGPDLNGVYGRLQGIGGLEAVVQESGGATTAMISDHFGNIVATSLYNPNQTSMATFPANRFSAYGPVPGYQPPILSLNTAPGACFGWLGKRIDETGRYHFGGRDYLPDERRWLSYDSMGWAGGPNPYGFCNGSPGYFMDPDGRCVHSAVWHAEEGVDALANAALGLILKPQFGQAPRIDPIQNLTELLTGHSAYVPSNFGEGLKQLSADLVPEGQNAMLAVGIRAGANEMPSAPEPPTSGARPSFYVTSDGIVVPSTGYRALVGSGVTEAQGGTMSPRVNPTYITFDNITGMTGPEVNSLLQLPGPARTAVAVFDTLQVANDLRIPTENWNQGLFPEPFAVSYPGWGAGGGSQAITDSLIQGAAVIALTGQNAPPTTIVAPIRRPVLRP